MFVPSLLRSLWSYGVNINVMCIYIYTIVWHFVLNKFVDHVAAGILGVRTSSQGIVKKCKFQEDGERQVDPMMGSTSTGISFVEHTTAWLYVGDLHPVFASEWTNCTCPHRDRLQPGLGWSKVHIYIYTCYMILNCTNVLCTHSEYVSEHFSIFPEGTIQLWTNAMWCASVTHRVKDYGIDSIESWRLRIGSFAKLPVPGCMFVVSFAFYVCICIYLLT